MLVAIKGGPEQLTAHRTAALLNCSSSRVALHFQLIIYTRTRGRHRLLQSFTPQLFEILGSSTLCVQQQHHLEEAHSEAA